MADSIFSPSTGTSQASAKPSIFSSAPSPAPSPTKSTPSPYAGPYASGYSPAVSQAVEKVAPTITTKISGNPNIPGLGTIFTPAQAEEYNTTPTPKASPSLANDLKSIWGSITTQFKEATTIKPPAKSPSVAKPIVPPTPSKTDSNDLQLSIQLGDINSHSSELSATQKELETESKDIVNLGTQIDKMKSKVDPSSQASIDSFNGLVNKYNDKLNAFTPKITDFQNSVNDLKTKTDSYNTALEKNNSQKQYAAQLFGDASKDPHGLWGAVWKDLSIPVKVLPAMISGIWKGETAPGEDVQNIEKNMIGGSELFGDAGKEGLGTAVAQDLQIPAKVMTRFFAPIIQGAGQNIADAILANSTGARKAYGITEADIPNLPSAKETILQGVGNFMQLAFAVATPGVAEKLGLAGASEATMESILEAVANKSVSQSFAPLAKIIGEMAVKGAINGGEAGLLFGTGQALSSGSKDPMEITSIIFSSAVGMSMLGAALGAGSTLTEEAKVALFKNVSDFYGIPKDFTIKMDAINHLIDTKQLSEEDGKSILKGFGFSDEQVAKMRSGEAHYTITRPTQDIFEITDKPYWAKIKSVIGLDSSTSQVPHNIKGAEITGEPTGVVPFTGEAPQETPIVPQTDIAKIAEEIKSPATEEAPSYKGAIEDLGLSFRKKSAEENPEEITSESGPAIIPTKEFRTFDFHEMEGKPQTPAEDAKIHDNIVNNPEKPMTPGGESFNEAASRAISTIKDISDKQDGNVAITTHNSMYGLLKLWSESGQPNTLDKTFREKYVGQDNSNPTGSSFVIKAPGGDIYVVRHGETEDNAKGVFRTAGATLTDKGRIQAQELAAELKGKGITKIYSSDLPRAIETSQIIQKGASTLDSIFSLDNNKGYGQGTEKGASSIRQSSETISSDGEGAQPPDRGSGERLGYSQDSEIFQRQLSEDLRASGGADTNSPKIAREVARGLPLEVDKYTFDILKATGFSPEFIDEVKALSAKQGFSRISISNRYKNGSGYYAIFDSKNNVLVLNPDEAKSVKYTDGSILRHEIEGHSWFHKLSPEGRKSFYDNLKQNIPLIKEAWEGEDNHYSFYWNETASQIYNQIWNSNSQDIADRIFKDFQLAPDKNISLDEFINKTLNIDKKIEAINKELERLGENKITLKAEDTAGVTEHVAMIAEMAKDLLSPNEDMIGNYIDDVKNGNLQFGSTAERALTYKGETDLSTTTLEKLKGRDTVSKQFIQDLTNSPDMKQVERDIIREVLAGYPDGAKIPVAQFAKDVKIELLPLEVEAETMSGETARYESIALPDDLRGNVADYRERIYASPIKTSAGNIHFSGIAGDNYFGHTRIEDMAIPGQYTMGIDDLIKARKEIPQTRRVIEVQSDLYQKGNLETEIKLSKGHTNPEYLQEKAKEMSKLQQYNDPTAHFRMIREEIKKAAEDGKTKLQFPTGETAMKIEGLGQNQNWYTGSYTNTARRDTVPLKSEMLKIGQEVNDSNIDWVITDVLGDGKFKAVPKSRTGDDEYFTQTDDNPDDLKQLPDGNFYNPSDIETFDISGKVDTNNPIYRFYEKDLGRYLRNKYDAKTITDDKGVSWNEINVKPEMANAPVLAFRQKTQDINQLKKMLEREEESLRVAEENPAAHARVYGPDRMDQYKAKIAELKERIAQAKNPVFNTGNKLEDLRATLANVEKRVGLENAPVDFKGNTLSELEQTQIELEAMKDGLDNNPLQNLEKFEAKSGIFKGELPEVLGKSTEEIKASKLYKNYKDKNVLEFMKRGDYYIGEAGFDDSEEARAAYQIYKDQKAQYKSILRNFTKDVKEYNNFIKQDEASLEKTGKSIPVTLADLEPPIVRGETQAPKLDFKAWKDVNDVPILSKIPIAGIPFGSTFRMGRDTFERNLEKVAPKEDAEKVKKFIVYPVRDNELARTKFNNELKESIQKKLKELDIKRNTTDDELIQVFGEGKMSLGELQKASPKKWAQIQSAAGFFRNIYDNLLDTWNQERQKFGYAPIPKVPNYFRHFDEINFFVQSYGFLRNQDQLPAEIAGKTEFFKPGKPFTTAEMHRTGDKTKYSAIGGFNNYIESVSKQIFHIDSLQRGRALEKYMENAAKLSRQMGEPLPLSNTMANLREYVNNQLGGKTATLDRAVESVIGRPSLRGISALGRLIGKNVIVGNIATAFSHLVTIPLIGATNDKIPLVKGAMATLTSPLKAEPFSHIDGQESSFLVRRYPMEEIMPSMPKTAEKALSYLFTVTDKFVAKLAVASKYYEGIKDGLSPEEAMKQADIYAGKVKGDYSLGQKPNIMNTKTLGLLAQFQLGLNDSMSVLLHDIPEEAKYETKNEKGETVTKRLRWQMASRWMQFIIFSWLFNQFLKNIRGSGKGIDPIDLGLTLTGLNKEGAGQPVLSRVGLAAKDLAGEIPFTSAFTGNFPLATAISQPIKDLMAGKFAATAVDILSMIGSPIGGGSQTKKTIQGALAIQKGESSGLAQNAKSLIFGASQAVTPDSVVSLKLNTKLKTANTKLAGYDQGTIDRVQPIFDKAKAAGFGTPAADELVADLSDYEYKVYKAMKSVDNAQQTIDLESKVLPIVRQAQVLGFGTPEADKLIADSFPDTPEGDKEYAAYQSVKASFVLKPPTGSVGNNNNGVANFEGHLSYYPSETGPDAAKILAGNSDDGKIKGKNPNGEPLFARDTAAEKNRKAEIYKADPFWKENGYTLGDTQFDHIVPLEAGGTNSSNNEMLIPKIADEGNQVFEDYLGNLYSSGRISRADAAKASIDYKIKQTVSLLDVMRGTY